MNLGTINYKTPKTAPPSNRAVQSLALGVKLCLDTYLIVAILIMKPILLFSAPQALKTTKSVS